MVFLYVGRVNKIINECYTENMIGDKDKDTALQVSFDITQITI